MGWLKQHKTCECVADGGRCSAHGRPATDAHDLPAELDENPDGHGIQHFTACKINQQSLTDRQPDALHDGVVLVLLHLITEVARICCRLDDKDVIDRFAAEVPMVL